METKECKNKEKYEIYISKPLFKIENNKLKNKNKQLFYYKIKEEKKDGDKN